MVSIGFTGDFCPMTRVEKQFETGDWKPLFDEVRPFFLNNDLNIIDLECPLTNHDQMIVKTGPHIKSKPETVEILSYLNCKLVVTANNHFKDYQWVGMQDTYDALKKHNIDWCGSGASIDEASQTKFLQIKEMSFAIINMAENEWTTTHDCEPGCNPIDYPRSLLKIQEAKDNNIDFIIVILHGGHEHYPLPSPRMKAQFRFMIDAGADAVVGHHTHIISGYEVYKDKPIFYSLGNFCFDWPGLRNDTWNNGMILRLVFDKSSGISFEYQFVHQNNKHVGVKHLTQQELTVQESAVQKLNSIIADDKQLQKYFEDYAESIKPIMQSRIQPYRNKYLVALHKRGLLPDIMGISKKKMLKILSKCESHREVLLHSLKKFD
ncbi:MAG: CapA family protein [Bacteroidetes bacterium]|jgi:poly-gamma-glutamate synthesis protein (capsule biosynthesis protein)|nr:CapA family protein [Bacteroidota bacterium]